MRESGIFRLMKKTKKIKRQIDIEFGLTYSEILRWDVIGKWRAFISTAELVDLLSEEEYADVQNALNAAIERWRKARPIV
jgi:hypothetical protein